MNAGQRDRRSAMSPPPCTGATCYARPLRVRRRFWSASTATAKGRTRSSGPCSRSRWRATGTWRVFRRSIPSTTGALARRGGELDDQAGSRAGDRRQRGLRRRDPESPGGADSARRGSRPDGLCRLLAGYGDDLSGRGGALGEELSGRSSPWPETCHPEMSRRRPDWARPPVLIGRGTEDEWYNEAKWEHDEALLLRLWGRQSRPASSKADTSGPAPSAGTPAGFLETRLA